MTKKSRSSWLLSIAALISFALLGLTALLSYQNLELKSQLARPQSQPAASLPAPQPTASQNQIGDPANWKTYTNQSYGFSFKYPETWVTKDVTNSTANEVILLSLYFGPTGQTSLGGYSISMSLQNVDNREFVEKRQFLKPMSQEQGVYTQYSPVIQDGKEILKALTIRLFDPETSARIYKEENYQIIIPLEENTLFIESQIEAKQTVDKILSSFEFTRDMVQTEGSLCGGYANVRCPPGYACSKEQELQDATGTCTQLTCPDASFVSCVPDKKDPSSAEYCASDYYVWIQENCPGVLIVY